MKVLRGTLTFILGMIIGIILFVVAIGGTVVALGMAIKVGALQSKFTDQEIIASDSDLYNQTMLDAVKTVIDDVKSFDTLSLSKLYDHYGISALQGIGGIDFKNKDFYSAPLKDIANDFSIIVNSFTLRDVSSLTGNDFEEFNLPILTDNLDNNVKTALDNILGSIKGDLTVRTIKTKLIPDFNIENDLIKALQDIPFSRFGSAVNAFKLCTFLDVDTDTFVPYGNLKVYVKADRYEEVSKADLKNASYVVPDGVETYNADAVASTEGGKEDTLVQKELRFVKKEKDGETSYVVDNSCYTEDFDADTTTLTFYRHIEYEEYKPGTTYPSGTEFFVKCYANRVTTFDNTLPGTYELYFKGYLSLKDLYVEDGGTMVELNSKVTSPTVIAYASAYKDENGDFVPAKTYSVTDETIKKESKLKPTDTPTRAAYFKVHNGTSKPLLQSFAYLSIAELQDMDDFVDNVTIGDVIEVNESSSKILQALKDTKFGEISDKIDTLKIDEVIDIDDDSSLLMRSLRDRGVTINELGTVVDDMSLDEVIDVVYDEYSVAADGEYVFVESSAADNYVLYNEKLHPEMNRYSRTRENETDPYVYTLAADGEYVKNGYYTKYDAAEHAGLTRYTKNTAITNASSLIMQSLALRECKINELGNITDDLSIYEIIDMTKDDTSHLMKSLAKKDCSLKEIGSIVDTLEIGEVIEIDDSSSLIMRSLNNHHTTINEMGTVVDTLTIDEVIEINDGSSLILRSLKNRGCKINEMGTVVDDLTIDEVIEITDSSSRMLKSLKKKGAKISTLGTTIDNMTLEEIIDIYEYHQVEASDSLSDNKFLVWQHGTDTQIGYVKYDETRHADEPVRYNYDGTNYVEVLDGKYVYTDTPTTFVKDSSGKYIKSPIAFEPVNRSLATIEAAYKYTWVKGNLDPSTPADAATFKALAESGNAYYFDGSDYLNNVTLCTYLFFQGATDSSKLDNLCYRENSALGTGNSYYQFSEPNLFVNVLGVFIPYEATNPAHYDMTVYALQTSPYVAGDESDYKYYVRYDEYKDVKIDNDGTNYTYDLGGTKLSATNKYSRQYCESVYLKCDDLTLYPIDQYFVFINGKYVQYDSAEHDGLDTFVVVQAFLATEEQIATLDEEDYVRVHVIHEKSAPVLRMMSSHNINDMGSVVGNAIIEDLMDISPDNMFGTDEIKNSKINNLGSAMSGLMNKMTISKLLDWANVTSIDPKVKSAIGDATLTAFFNSLTYQNGSITVDMLKLYGLN